MVKRTLAIGAIGVLVLPALACAQGVSERLTRLEKKVEAQQAGVASALGVDLHALVSSTYQWSFNKPKSGIQLRALATNHDNLDLNQASLFVSRQREDEDFGFSLALDFGQEAEALGSATRWGSSSESSNSIELREAFFTYDAPIGDGLKLKFGKFVTLLGHEVIRESGNVNHNISHSILFGFAIPFTHTGLLSSYSLGDVFSVDLGVVNGWDNVSDNNSSKTLLAGIGINPTPDVSMYVAGTYGAEARNNQQRGVVTVNVVFSPTEQLTFVADAVYGNEDDLLEERPSGSMTRSADWYGAAAYALVGITDELSVNLRFEVFDDPDGVRTGISGPSPGGTFWEVTPTIAYQLTDNILARVEYRHDEASVPFFEKEGRRLLSGNDTVAAEILLAF